jgi:hypothetical protein
MFAPRALKPLQEGSLALDITQTSIPVQLHFEGFNPADGLDATLLLFVI